MSDVVYQVVLNVAEPEPQPASSKMAKPSGLAALKGFLRSPPPDQTSPEPQEQVASAPRSLCHMPWKAVRVQHCIHH